MSKLNRVVIGGVLKKLSRLEHGIVVFTNSLDLNIAFFFVFFQLWGRYTYLTSNIHNTHSLDYFFLFSFCSFLDTFHFSNRILGCEEVLIRNFCYLWQRRKNSQLQSFGRNWSLKIQFWSIFVWCSGSLFSLSNWRMFFHQKWEVT